MPVFLIAAEKCSDTRTQGCNRQVRSVSDMATIYGTNTSNLIDGDDAGNLIFGWAEANAPGDEGGARDNDTLLGGAGNDTMHGGHGKDSIGSFEGQDLIYGGAEKDKVSVDVYMGAALLTDRMATVYGGDGADQIDVGRAVNSVSLYGGAGADKFVVLGGQSTIHGDDGRDDIRLGSFVESARVLGGADVDILTIDRSDTAAEFVFDLRVSDAQDGFSVDQVERLSFAGGEGDDTVSGGSQGDRLFGNGGKDLLHGRAGNDFLREDSDWNLLFGGDGADTLFSLGGSSSLFGGQGRDIVKISLGAGAPVADGGAGVDTLILLDRASKLSGQFEFNSGDGNSKLFGKSTYKNFEILFFTGGKQGDYNITGGAFGDLITTSLGSDSILGGAGHDTLSGGGSGDRLAGGVGADALSGGAGIDTLIGGAGEDTFQFKGVGGGTADVIRDFASGEDSIRLHSSLQGKGAIGLGRLSEGQFHIGKAAQDANDRLIYDAETGRLFIDLDGTGSQRQTLVAILEPETRLKASDIFVGGFDL
jgi:Ca2+-binding RTX toxin-like protein